MWGVKGHPTLEGCIEMVRMMKYINHFDGCLKDGTLHAGWVDVMTGDICGKYEKAIMSH